MSAESNDRDALFARLRDAYAPSEIDAQRVRAKIDEARLAATKADPPAVLDRLGVSSVALVIAGALLIGGGVLGYRATTERSPVAAVPLVRTEATSPSPPASTASAPVALSPSVSAELLLDVPAVSVDALPSAPPARTPVPISQPTVEANTDTLEREARLLADARRALQAGEPERALALLDEHARAFPNGFLASDRAAERIDVLCRLGRRDDAVRSAKVFLEGHPTTPLAHRVKTSCAGQDGR